MSFFYFYLFILVHPYLAMWWKTYERAGRQSWEALIPVYNYYVAFKVFNKKPWWFLLLIVPGVHLVMLAVLNVSFIRRFGYFSLLDTIQGILFPYLIFAKIANSQDTMLPETNWANSKEVSEREWGDHLVLFLSLPVIGHVIAIGIAAVTRAKPGTKTKVKEWGDSIIFALVAALIIRTYVFEPFKIPTGSMERTLLVGDFLFVNKLAYGPKVPLTPLSYPLVHNTVPWINIKSYTSLEKGTYTRLPGFGKINRYDVMVFNYPAGDTAVYDPRMPFGLMGHEYEGIVIKQAFQLYADQLAGRAVQIRDFYTDSLKRNGINSQKTIDDLTNERVFFEFMRNIDKWKSEARNYIASGKTYSEGEGKIIDHKGIIYRPVDKRENYIKRCVGLPGDYIQIKNSTLFINDKQAKVFPNQNILYLVDSSLVLTEDALYKDFGIEQGDLAKDYSNGKIYGIHCNTKMLARLTNKYGKNKFEKQIIHQFIPDGTGRFKAFEQYQNLQYFPKDPNVSNNATNFERIQIPYSGKVVDFTKENIAYYRRIITAYEGHSLVEKNGAIYIDGKKTTKYTVEMNYYWLMGDNRYNSADSRVWGFVPEDHVVGKASMVWFSSNPTYGVRWERIFKLIE